LDGTTPSWPLLHNLTRRRGIAHKLALAGAGKAKAPAMVVSLVDTTPSLAA